MPLLSGEDVRTIARRISDGPQHVSVYDGSERHHLIVSLQYNTLVVTRITDDSTHTTRFPIGRHAMWRIAFLFKSGGAPSRAMKALYRWITNLSAHLSPLALLLSGPWWVIDTILDYIGG